VDAGVAHVIRRPQESFEPETAQAHETRQLDGPMRSRLPRASNESSRVAT